MSMRQPKAVARIDGLRRQHAEQTDVVFGDTMQFNGRIIR